MKSPLRIADVAPMTAKLPNRVRLLPLLALLLCPFLATPAPGADDAFTIAFGSCLRQERAQPVWQTIEALTPDVFIFAGDNFYADTRDPDVLSRHYHQLAASAPFVQLRQTTRVLAVWDDHDYGESDAGGSYPLKELSHRLFRETFELAPDSRAWQGPGIYDSHRFEWHGRSIQVLLLDTRSFRSPLPKRSLLSRCPYPPSNPQADPDATLLGEAQWAWLEERLAESADLRLLVSSIQVLPDGHCWEKWANFPHERARLLDLVRRHRVGGLIILSGDRHYADISRLPAERVGYPLYEVTASGLNTAGGFEPEANPLRVPGAPYSGDHFGVLTLSEGPAGHQVSLEVRDTAGSPVIREEMRLDELQFDGRPVPAAHRQTQQAASRAALLGPE